MFIAIRSGANATRKLDFCGAGMATFVTTDPLVLCASYSDGFSMVGM